jgi:hypothetical protein
MIKIYLFDERSGDHVKCTHCNKEIKKSKYYIIQEKLFDESNMQIIGSGCLMKVTGMAIKELKKHTEEIMNRG